MSPSTGIRPKGMCNALGSGGGNRSVVPEYDEAERLEERDDKDDVELEVDDAASGVKLLSEVAAEEEERPEGVSDVIVDKFEKGEDAMEATFDISGVRDDTRDFRVFNLIDFYPYHNSCRTCVDVLVEKRPRVCD